MNCQKCGAILNENTKFCTICGTNVFPENIKNPNLDVTTTPKLQTENPNLDTTTASKQPVENFTYNQHTLQQSNKKNQEDWKCNPILRIFKSNTTFKVIAGIELILILWIMVENNSLKGQINDYVNTLNDYKSQLSDYKDQITDYENKGAFDKTIDTIDSWLDMLLN